MHPITSYHQILKPLTMKNLEYTEVMEGRLEDLLEKNKDAEKLFEKAAEHANSGDLKDFFSQKSVERNGFGYDLKIEMKSFALDGDKEGTAGGMLQRGWIDVKAFFSNNNDKTMLKEAINGEKAALEDYREVLEMPNLPSSTEVLLTQQMGTISANLSTFERLVAMA